MKKCYIGSDHAGFRLKEFAKEFLQNKGVEVIDLGPANDDRVDYPDFAQAVCEKVASEGESFGVLVCGTGIGMSISANKIKGIRAALAQDAYTAAMGRAHNDANVLCFGARVVGEGVAESILSMWLEAGFEGGRHSDRVQKIKGLEG